MRNSLLRVVIVGFNFRITSPRSKILLINNIIDDLLYYVIKLKNNL